MMREFQLNPISSKEHRLFNPEGIDIGTLHYGYFSSIATATFQGEQIKIKNKSFFQQNYQVTVNGVVNATITSGRWFKTEYLIVWGTMDRIQHTFELKSKGMFSSAFVLLDANGSIVCDITKKSSWFKASYLFNVDTSALGSDVPIEQLLMICGFVMQEYFKLIMGMFDFPTKVVYTFL